MFNVSVLTVSNFTLLISCNCMPNKPTYAYFSPLFYAYFFGGPTFYSTWFDYFLWFILFNFDKSVRLDHVRIFFFIWFCKNNQLFWIAIIFFFFKLFWDIDVSPMPIVLFAMIIYFKIFRDICLCWYRRLNLWVREIQHYWCLFWH